MLAAYGVPMISDDGKFTSSYIKLDDGGQRTICAFAFPANWVEANKREGFMTAANYQSGDGLVFNVGAPRKAKAIGDVSVLTIVAESTPSDGVAKVNRTAKSKFECLLSTSCTRPFSRKQTRRVYIYITPTRDHTACVSVLHQPGHF